MSETTPPTVGETVTLTVTRTITGTVTSVQMMGCTHGTHATIRGRRVWTTTHGADPCPDRHRIAALGIRDHAHRLHWVYTEGQTVTVEPTAAVRAA